MTVVVDNTSLVVAGTAALARAIELVTAIAEKMAWDFVAVETPVVVALALVSSNQAKKVV